MSILVICGHQGADCAAAESALRLAGLPEAAGFRDGEFTAPVLIRKICHAYKLNGSKRKGYSQVSPGKLWQALSVDLMLANMEAESWGWAEPRNIHFLDYWRDFDRRFNFLLVYSSPEQVVARLLEKGPVEPEAVEAALADWRAYNEEMLRFYNANADRSILVDAGTIADGPVDFLSACRERFELDLRRINEPLDLDGKVSAMALWSASALLSGSRDVAALFDEMESVADMPRAAAPDPKRMAGEAWAGYGALAKELEEVRARQQAGAEAQRALEDRNAALEAELDAARRDLEEIGKRKAELEAAIAALRQEKDRLTRDGADLRARVEKGEKQAEEAKKENGLLLLQLHQVQEELEDYFVKYRDLQAVEEKNGTLQRTLEAREAELGKARLDLAEAAKRKGELEAAAATRAAELDKARLGLADAEKRKGELEAAIAALRKEKEKLAGDNGASSAALRAQAEEAKKENGLLLMQLHQVQEELEHYFHKYRDLQTRVDAAPDGAQALAAAPQPGAGPQPTAAEARPVVIDMRHFIDGENWHNAEEDGRWAGPGKRSTLRLPKLGKGRYRLEVDVVDAMTPEIVRNMRVSLNGAPVAMARRPMDGLAGMLAPLKRAWLVHYKGRQLYPLRFSGVVDVGGDPGVPPLQIEFDFPDAVSPASRGDMDSRNLAVRLKQVAITPC